MWQTEAVDPKSWSPPNGGFDRERVGHGSCLARPSLRRMQPAGRARAKAASASIVRPRGGDPRSLRIPRAWGRCRGHARRSPEADCGL